MFIDEDYEGFSFVQDVTCRRDDHKIRSNNIQNTCMVQQTWESDVYVQLNKALYGKLQLALLFLKLLSETLQEWGFTLNPFDKCIANKI